MTETMVTHIPPHVSDANFRFSLFFHPPSLGELHEVGSRYSEPFFTAVLKSELLSKRENSQCPEEREKDAAPRRVCIPFLSMAVRALYHNQLAKGIASGHLLVCRQRGKRDREKRFWIKRLEHRESGSRKGQPFSERCCHRTPVSVVSCDYLSVSEDSVEAGLRVVSGESHDCLS